MGVRRDSYEGLPWFEGTVFQLTAVMKIAPGGGIPAGARARIAHICRETHTTLLPDERNYLHQCSSILEMFYCTVILLSSLHRLDPATSQLYVRWI